MRRDGLVVKVTDSSINSDCSLGKGECSTGGCGCSTDAAAAFLSAVLLFARQLPFRWQITLFTGDYGDGGPDLADCCGGNSPATPSVRSGVGPELSRRRHLRFPPKSEMAGPFSAGEVYADMPNTRGMSVIKRCRNPKGPVGENRREMETRGERESVVPRVEKD